MNRFLKGASCLLLALAMAACGGGGGSPGATGTGGTTGGGTTTGGTGGTGGTGTTTPTAAALDVFTSTPELSTAAASSVTFNVTVKDANNQAIPNQTVTFAASSGNLTGALPAPSTGANGQPITSVSLSPGTDRSNRNITVTVTAGGISRQVSVPVTGSTLTLNGAGFVLVGAGTTFTVKATDSAGQPIPNATLAVTSALGNTITPANPTTNTQGTASFLYTGTHSGSDTITVSGVGATATAPISVSADQFSFDSPASGALIAVGASQPVSVQFLVGGVPQVNQQVTFSTTRGTIAPTSVFTDATGHATANVTSSSSGPANIVAQTASAQVTLPLTFVAVAPTNLVLQANPGSVRPNAAGSTNNQAALQATVRDAAGNPVAGKVVNFTAQTDPSNGSISPGTATTDASGTAVAQFIAGPLSTANGGVVVQATVQGTAITGTASLTVNAQALFIAINTGNDIGNLNPTTYEKQFAVAVTDANGTPPPVGTPVTLSVYPLQYGKGTLSLQNNVWQYTGIPKFCPNEDVNRDGVLQATEDANSNGRLDPGLPVIVSPSQVATDATGSALFTLRYGENFAPWLDVEITARAVVGGTESVKTQLYRLQGANGDFTNATVPPAGAISPFGTVLDCTSPL